MTFVIPTYNAQEYLINCLSSIRRQTRPSKIIIVDGGSTDSTLEIAQAYKCTILPNTRKLAEFGVQIGILATKSPWVVVFAADNELPRLDWLEGVECYINNYETMKGNTNGISAVWGKIVGDEKLINQYFGLIQNDPLSWFINKNLYKEYLWYLNPRKSSNCFYNLYVKPEKPLIWGANGLVYRTERVRKFWDTPCYVGDNDAFQGVIETGEDWVVYYDGSFVIHHHCKSISHCVGKWWRNHTQHYLAHKSERNMRWLGRGFYFKVVLWLIYVPLSFPHSVYLAIRDKNLAWLYHFPLSFLQMCVFILGRVKCGF